MLDQELVRAFVDRDSQDAFAELVRRYIDAVYAAARRQLRDASAAEDATQAVFILLARKAGTLDPDNPLAGWLLKTAHFACRDILKSEARRRRHERGAAVPISSEALMVVETEKVWGELDAAVAQLSPGDRSVIALRYLRGQSVAEAARELGISPEAAGKRIGRALERLRRGLFKRHAIDAGAGLTGILEQIPRLSAPTALAAKTAAAALSPGLVPAGVSVAQGVLKMMMWTKIKLAAIAIAIAGVVAGGGVVTVSLLDAQTAPLPAQPARGLAAGNPAAVGDTFDSGPGLVASLEDGVAIRLDGVTDDDAGKKPWWNADGSPLKNGPYGRMNFASSVAPAGRISTTSAVEVKHSVQGDFDPATVKMSVLGGKFPGGGSIRPRPGKIIEYLIAVLPPTAAGQTIRADIAAGAWKTVGASANGGNETVGGTMQIYFFPPFARDHGFTGFIIDATGKIFASDDLRMVAIDRNGMVHVGRSGSSDQMGDSVTAEFDVQLPLASIDHWEVQVRPFDQWIEIRNVAVRPGQNNRVEIVTSDRGK